MSEQTTPTQTTPAVEVPVTNAPTTVQYIETKSNKGLYILLAILGVIAFLVIAALILLFVNRSGGLNVPGITNLLNGTSPKQALQNVMDASNVAELAKKSSTYGNSKVDLNIQMSQGSIVISGTGTNQSDLLNKLMQSDMKLTGKLNMGIINFDFGDGMDVSYISKTGATNQNTETYVKYSFSDSLKSSLSSLGASSFTSVVPDKYIKISLTSSASAEDLNKGTEMVKQFGDIFKRILLDYESYATVTQSQNGDIAVYSFKIDSTKFSTRLMQEKSAILAIINVDATGSTPAQNEKSFNDIVNAVKYLNFDKMNIGIRSNYIASEDISVSMTKDGINYLKSLDSTMSSGTQTTFDVTGFNMNVSSTMNYSDNKSSIVVPTDFYTQDQWNQKLGLGQETTYQYVTSTTSADTVSYPIYRYNQQLGEECKFFGGDMYTCTDGLVCKIDKDTILTGGGWSGVCAQESDCSSFISSTLCRSK